MCDAVTVSVVQDKDGISVQVTSGTDQGVRLEHAADVALRVFGESLAVEAAAALTYQHMTTQD